MIYLIYEKKLYNIYYIFIFYKAPLKYFEFDCKD